MGYNSKGTYRQTVETYPVAYGKDAYAHDDGYQDPPTHGDAQANADTPANSNSNGDKETITGLCFFTL